MVEITTLGSFYIRVSGEVITDQLKGSSKLWRLLDLLIINRNKPISVTTIMDNIWQEDETKTDKKTIHNLVYRLRNTLSDGSGINYVSYGNNRYSLSSNLNVDVFRLEDYYKLSENPELTRGEKRELLEKACDLYNGEYTLSIYNDDIWTISVSNKYKRLYTDMIVALADLYLELREYDLLFKLLYKAVSLEPLTESIYVRLVQGLRDTGRVVQAIELCENYFSMLYREMGLQATEQLNMLYWELKGGTPSQPDDLDGAMTGLQETSGSHAYYCDFKTFKDIYRYQIRQNLRTEAEIALMLVGLRWTKAKNPGDKVFNEAKQFLRAGLLTALRKCDVISDFSDSKIIVMMVNLYKDNDKIIIKRVEDMFYERYDKSIIKIEIKFKITT